MEQVFTDALMFFVSAVVFAVASVFLVLFLRRDGVHSLWWILVLAYLVPHSMVMYGYFLLWQNPETPTQFFPTVAQFTRPGILGIYSFVLLVLYLLARITHHGQ